VFRRLQKRREGFNFAYDERAITAEDGAGGERTRTICTNERINLLSTAPKLKDNSSAALPERAVNRAMLQGPPGFYFPQEFLVSRPQPFTLPLRHRRGSKTPTIELESNSVKLVVQINAKS
jgi:hypothetical protein